MNSYAQQPSFGRRQGGMAPPNRYSQAEQTGQSAVRGQANFQTPPAYAGANHNVSAGQSSGAQVIKRPVKGARFLSGLVDYFLVMVIGGGIIGVLQGFSLSNLAVPELIKFYGALAIMSFLYGLVMEARFQGTVGKIVTGTVVVNEDGSPMSFGKVFGRNLAKFVSFIVPLYIAYLMVLWTKNNQTLHDIIAGTFVYPKAE